ncbi:DNA-processing protein DprA [Microbacterium sp. SSW1-49]|uniref:DNA-processing protein DprA n=2 Tax=Microbacterium croceum TaxID=2851645 RepID=A0ABT0FF06_9MICO|nr:DNA-processing protein DprA [Microbacterium croceum]
MVDEVRLLRAGEEVVDALARTAWSVLAEPGDGVAGALIQTLGAEEALRYAIDGTQRDGAVDALLDTADARVRHAVAEGRRRWVPRVEVRAVRDALRGAREVGAQLLLPGDDLWPHALDDLGANAPIALWVRGDPSCMMVTPRVALVGARASSGYGDHVAAEIAGDLAASGALIVSGAAYGIDGAAHRAALGVGGGTVAFLAGGVDRAYPAGHHGLLKQIAEEGAVLSELPCGAAPTKWRFLARNRLIAALGDATVVVEAGWRSGSLNTAGHAASLGRPLGAVPGSVTSASSAGCHRLLREYDAVCVTSAADVRELCGLAAGVVPTAEGVDPERVRVLDALGGRTSLPTVEIARRSGLSTERVLSHLGLLELEGLVHPVGGGWRRTPV